MQLTAVVWIPVFLAASSLLLLRRHPVPVGLLGVAYVLALIAGLVSPPAAVIIALLTGAAYARGAGAAKTVACCRTGRVHRDSGGAWFQSPPGIATRP